VIGGLRHAAALRSGAGRDRAPPMENATDLIVSPSEKRTLQHLVEGELHTTELDWVAADDRPRRRRGSGDLLDAPVIAGSVRAASAARRRWTRSPGPAAANKAEACGPITGIAHRLDARWRHFVT
jgi:hypothetical protein